MPEPLLSIPVTLAQAPDATARAHEISGTQIVVLAILVLYLGEFITRHVRFLRDNNIPTPVTGGLVCSIAVALISWLGDFSISFDLSLRDTLLLIFFSTIGLGARMRTLVTGGRALVVLVIGCAAFLVVQDITGIAVAMLTDRHPGFGLLGGSISFAGGHGTAIAWGEEATKAGLVGASEFGIACATFGLIFGGLLGGPVAGRLIRRHRLEPRSDEAATPESAKTDDTAMDDDHVHVNDIIGTILALGLCLGFGDTVNRYLFAQDIKLPGFLTAMMVGIVLTNLADPLKFKLSKPAIDLVGGVSLQLFLTMSLMSMDLLSLMESASVLLMIVLAQSLVITCFAVFVVFRIMGRDYDAAVISGGFMGMGLGATPVAIANMDAITRKYGPSTKALLVVPLVGAFFIDIVNAAVIKFFIGLPILQRAVE
ncbi:MAG: sodium/glutamate symporter [Phycisphaeraceae bacterium]|nr:sodium/glutamate symporter [Phycisphaeraceae bacterium]